MMKIILKAFAVLFVFALQVKADTSSVPQIKIQGESGVFVLPLDQPVATWAKIYGMGWHNEKIPTSMGWSMSWRFHRIEMAVTFTGSPLIATEVSISANEGQQPLSLAEATAIAHSLGLRNSKPDPNMEGAPLWSGDHISVRFLGGAELGNLTAIDMWTDKFPDPTGMMPEPE